MGSKLKGIGFSMIQPANTRATTLGSDREVVHPSADAELSRRVQNHLLSHLISSIHDLSIEAVNGVVTLSGNVRSFYHKQLCIHCCKRVAGVVQLVDNIQVLR